ncbi:acyltransferase [Bradyrhizobium sp. CCGB12]|uniref:acyltransferase family protein n=1 Tax=Bradyrhizobium sp. CCGB12 TaxID=2949632 RepID=UPI0020B23266|nr:acyltransferase family protein [Bradyrhizobium sp. CCGB12]MCP3388857.1 acyltransferase [Bradyrhizobium sp. CCGB12]
MKFRGEIVQLRAIAVLSVLLFHLKVPGFQGGFVGVDVFFVISGYLITRNILRDEAAGRFSFGAFYLRRTRRIYPALILTVALTYLVGALWSAPLLFLDIAKECTHALLSIANIQYWKEASHYFAAKSDELALLHCWSLSLEEQFYLLWPALLIAAARVNCLRSAIALISIVSFMAAAWIGPIDSSAAFFLMPFRIFEFGCGALVLFVDQSTGRRASRELLSAGGLVVIIGSALLLRPDTIRQELLVLLPCLGAAAFIMAGDTTFVSRALRLPPLMTVGTISYSLYLCHWPIIFYCRFIFGDAVDTTLGTVSMLVSMLLVAAMMYRFVELRFIVVGPVGPGPWIVLTRFSIVTVAIVAVTHLTFVSKGFAWRLPASVIADGRLDSPSVSENVEGITSDPPTIELVGDSHAEMYLAGLLPLVRTMRGNIQSVGSAGCPILFGLEMKNRRREACKMVRDESLELLRSNSRPIIWVQRWDLYDDAILEYEVEGSWSRNVGSFTKLEHALFRTLNELARDRRILLVGAQVPASCEINRPRLLQGPLGHTPPSPCPPVPRASVEAMGEAINAMLSRVSERLGNRVELIKPIDYICDTTCVVFHEGHWLYWDPTHFTLAGSHYMVDRLKEPLIAFLQASNGIATSHGTAAQ